MSVSVAFITGDWRDELKRAVDTENLDFSHGWGEMLLIGDKLVIRDVTQGSEQVLFERLERIVSVTEKRAQRAAAAREQAREEMKSTLLTRPRERARF